MLTRRNFLQAAAATAATFSINAVGANERVVLGVMGIGGRGGYLAQEFAKRGDVEIRYLCDIDSRLFESRSASVEAITKTRPTCTQEYRELLDDPEVDGIISATPDHWHALSTITACQAAKDVYVEKPTSHSIWESQKMVEAARKHKRVVQVGAQNRSAEYNYSAYEYIHSEAFGDIHFVRVLNSKHRTPIMAQPDGPTPEGVDYDRWLGPAPARTFNPIHFRGGWNWLWAYSGGDIINDGIHQIDVARWMIDKPYPVSTNASGGNWGFNDAQEAPTTMTANWNYDDLTMVYEQTHFAPYMKKTPLAFRDQPDVPNWPFSGTRIEIYGTKQMLMLSRHGGGWEAFDGDGKSVALGPGNFSEANAAHFENFVDCIRTRKEPTGDIEKLHLSTLLSHYGNIAFRTGQTLRIDPETEGFHDSPEANALVKRTYRDAYSIGETV